ncbi:MULTISPECIES: hypothetical protein [Haloferax]|jgi:hypothetical protein|uniref:Uncharacterized protein n=2 Tax=Haloferax TaxID=2251 RepID=A0ACD5HV10_9EURY|nr:MULTISPECIES: hypothetical protein [Haloferax]
MRVVNYTVTGGQFSDLIDALTERFSPEESHTGDGFAVLLIEKYEFWRTNSNMQVTIILEEMTRTTWFLKIVVGGGASGIFNWTYGSEQKVLRKMTTGIEELIDELDMKIKSNAR